LYTPAEVSPAPPAKTLTPTLLPEYKASAEPEAYAEVIDRPLFSPSRRQAPPPPTPEPPKPVMQTGQYALTGTMQVGDKLYAFLRSTKDGKGLRAAQGDVLAGGITLAKVEPGRIVLKQYESEEEVRLQVSKSTRTTPAAPPPLPQPAQPGQPGFVMPGAVPGAPGVPGMMTPQGGIVTATNPSPGAPQMVHEVPVTVPQPGAPSMAPFVPGVSPTPQNTPVPPRRRGAMQ
jgi:general secretion pathway protein N